MINLIGQKFGKLTPFKYVGRNKRRESLWLCKCDCGNETMVPMNSLKSGNTKSCGCREGNLIHGYSRTKTHIAWGDMKQRCNNPNHPKYKDYGGRGITICERWLEPEGRGFANFLKDMGEIPKNKELDRIDNNLLINGYSPENCKLSTRKEQCRNTRKNHIEILNNKSQCRSALAEEYGVNPTSLNYRLDIIGLSIKEALTIPIRKRRPLLILNYERQLNGSLRNLKLKKINFSKILGYSSRQLLDHLKSIRNNQNNCCPMCNISYEINSSDIEHIIPVSTAKTREDLLKLFNLNNLSLLCYKCNRYVKRGRLDIKYNYGF